MFLALHILILGALIGAIIALTRLFIIDLRIRLLPNIWVLTFALCGVAFHCGTGFALLAPQDALLGLITGYGFLYLVRWAANAYYQDDALGLGDVKLMGAAGLWLGVDGILFALSLGAFAGLIHGLGYIMYQKYKTGQTPPLHRLSIPAGPGFITGIVCVGLWQYGQTVVALLHF